MSENKIIPDIIDSASKAIQQNLPETASQSDGVLSTVVGFFNNVVLYPVKKANITCRYKLEQFEDDMKEKIKNIPDENLQVPPIMIAGPTLESLKYTYDEKELREMYENLLASAMDNRISQETHPSFVDAIKQMSPTDAKILSKFADLNRIRCAGIKFKIKNTSKIYLNAMPDYFVTELLDISDPFSVSASLSNLQRLGLLTITDLGLIDTNYDDFKEHPYVLLRKSQYEKLGREFDISVENRAVITNDYGTKFIKTCLGKAV